MTKLKKSELKQRVLAKKHELQSKMEELKAEDSSKADEQVNELAANLKEVEDMISDGWDNLSDATVEKLNSRFK